MNRRRVTVIFTNTLGATGRVYDVADASGWLIAPASCTKMCNIDSVGAMRIAAGLPLVSWAYQAELVSRRAKDFQLAPVAPPLGPRKYNSKYLTLKHATSGDDMGHWRR
jgi:hypothetical protein